GPRLVARDELHDRRNLVGTDGRDDIRALLILDDQAGDVTDEVASLLLLEDEAANVARLRREQGVRDVDARELRVRERARDLVEWLEHQEPDADDQAIPVLRGSPQVRE